MTISVGSMVPGATLLHMGSAEPEAVDISATLKGRNVVIFGLPGAFTRTCSSAHVPSFIRVAEDLKAKGVDAIICVSVNDPFVMKAWGEATGATAAGITMLADSASEFTAAIGMTFSNVDDGFINRSKRYAMYVKDGKVMVLNAEPGRGVCDISGGEAMLAAI